jgi:hypothetical protein
MRGLLGQTWTHSRPRLHGRPSVVYQGHTADACPTPSVRQTKMPLYCALWTCRHTTYPLSCPTGVVGGHTAESLYHPHHFHDLSATCLHMAEGLPCVCTWQRVCRVQKQLPCILHTRQVFLFLVVTCPCKLCDLNLFIFLYNKRTIPRIYQT